MRCCVVDIEPADEGHEAGYSARVMACDRCDGRGRIEYGHPNAPHADYEEDCGACGGTGEAVVEFYPLDEDEDDGAYPTAPTEIMPWQ